ncbi:23S rRNA (guanine(745)-N(1))-methyltransferase [Thalassotalea euphylliae]|uniref:23S rRNA (Guanine(745)-N(1))-methyltransferase n=1 Tax=Thalassotalea euphylliae TaxID=1655234 RepID=A0A3E0TYG0_9GAMM|nr:23S rRNA (guanine(745)-N(1))-methyltransferase [Thalassotalea euphylliae]REL29403.1 23S rRNA (guanine(745)-N(1))-methyltransferase [Thalassotalea euphylliae]
MSVSVAEYSCPICQSPLALTNSIYRCEQNHCFDLAKENYVNLLPVQFKHSKNPGDNKAMVNARRAFLEKSYYQPLIECLVAKYQEFGLATGKLLDAGCGEGYYTHQHKQENNQVYGVDIAKEAIKKAGKKYHDCHFSVGTLSKLSFADSFFDWIVSIYAPILEPEFTRVLAEQGYLITVTPGANHLAELKQQVYQQALPHDETRQPISELTLVDEWQLGYPMTLATGEDCLNLLSMTPFAFKASEQVKEWLAKQVEFTCQADFLIKLYQKN